jgi:hypothetical protein
MRGMIALHPARRIGTRLLALAVLAALIAGACDGTSAATNSGVPTGSGSPSIAASGSPGANQDQETYAAIEGQVQGLRGLEPTAAISPVLLDAQGVRSWMENAFETQVDHTAMAATSRLFIHLGLLPAGSSLERMQLDLLSGQVVGFYDTTSKKLYLLSKSGGVGVLQKWTFSHEYTHALQDQVFSLDKLEIDAPDQSDRDIARTALVEGDAMLVTDAWMQHYMSLLDQLGLLGEALGDPSTGQLEGAPAILRIGLMFPYEEGAGFAGQIYKQGGWTAVNALYDNPPNSTSQILHPELYTSGVQPVEVKVPAVPASLGSGWELALQDTMGELQLRVWLEGEAPTAGQRSAAADAVSAWGGDRIGLYEGPNDTWAVVLLTNWRTASGKVAFQNAASGKLGNLGGPAVVCGDGMNVGLYVASNVTTLEMFAPCHPPL